MTLTPQMRRGSEVDCKNAFEVIEVKLNSIYAFLRVSCSSVAQLFFTKVRTKLAMAGTFYGLSDNTPDYRVKKNKEWRNFRCSFSFRFRFQIAVLKRKSLVLTSDRQRFPRHDTMKIGLFRYLGDPTGPIRQQVVLQNHLGILSRA